MPISDSFHTESSGQHQQASSNSLLDSSGRQGSETPCYKNPTFLVAMGVLIGGSIGITLSEMGQGKSNLSTVLALPGLLWLKALKCIVLPMIIFAMVEAMVMLRNLPGAKSVGVAVVGLYTFTTVVAATEGCIVAAVIIGPNIEQVGNITTVPGAGDKPKLQNRSAFDTILSIFSNLVPKNLVNDAATMQLLPVIVASIIFGLLMEVRDEEGKPSRVLELIQELNRVVVKVVTGIMTLTPIGVSSLVFGSAARLDLDKVGKDVMWLIIAVVVGLLLHLCVVYPTMLVVLARVNPLNYYRNILPAFATAFGTSSSAATLPLSISCAIEKNGISPYIANFVLSLGATINMDGTSIYLICACFFLGDLNGIAFGIGDFITMALLATLCSMGSAPVPSASLVLLVTIMTSVGVPDNETFGIISGVDWMLDRLRTTVNVAGDAAVTACINAKFGDRSDDPDLEMTSEMTAEASLSCNPRLGATSNPEFQG